MLHWESALDSLPCSVPRETIQIIAARDGKRHWKTATLGHVTVPEHMLDLEHETAVDQTFQLR